MTHFLAHAFLSIALIAPLRAEQRAEPRAVLPGLPADEVSDLIEAIAKGRDETPVEDIERLAGYASREAAVGLVNLYDLMSTPFMRREIVRALASFAGTAAAEQPALQKLIDVATGDGSRELRMAAIDGLGREPGLGHPFLERIVMSPAEDGVRVRALRLHVLHSSEQDRDWYQALFDADKEHGEKPNRTGSRRERDAGSTERELKVHILPELREVAFTAIAADMSTRQLLAATEDGAANVRRKALEALLAKDPKLAVRRATEVFEGMSEKDSNRVQAAEVLAEVKGTRAAPLFIEVGIRFATPQALRVGLARLLSGFDDASVDRTLVKLLGKSRVKPHEAIFAMQALGSLQDPKLTERILKRLHSEDAGVRIAAIEALGRRGDVEGIEALQELFGGAEHEETMVAAIEALTALRGEDPAWREELLGYASGAETPLRNSALMALGGKPENLAVLAEAATHERWTTRAIALKGMANIGTNAVLPVLIERLGKEDGRLRGEIGDFLVQLTGQPFPPNHDRWAAWWNREGADYEMPDEKELELRLAVTRERELRRSTQAEFLGVEIESHRVIFLIDTSGSMNDPLRSRFVGESAGEARMAVARRELKSAINALDAATLFNLITFDSGIQRWLSGGVATSDKSSRENAIAWIDGLAALGGTNLFGGLEAAFSDPDVDTIFVLSDGEPSVGDIIDPFAIRTQVKRWNKHRGVLIHTMAIGTSLDVLAWLAEDSGGTYREFR